MCEIGHATGVAPFIVVPGDNLDEVVGEYHGREAIVDGGMRICAKVGGDQGLLGIRENALEPSCGGQVEGGVDGTSRLAGSLSVATKSTTETVAVGTRRARPSSLPARSGITSPSARAAPVVVGMMFAAAARARRKSL